MRVQSNFIYKLINRISCAHIREKVSSRAEIITRCLFLEYLKVSPLLTQACCSIWLLKIFSRHGEMKDGMRAKELSTRMSKREKDGPLKRGA